MNDFKSKFAPKKWKQKFQELVGVGTSLEHNHECYVKGAECQGDPKAIFRFVSAVKASSKVIKAMVLKHEANDAYKNLPPNEKYDGHVGGVGDTATHLLKNYSATVGPVTGNQCWRVEKYFPPLEPPRREAHRLLHQTLREFSNDERRRHTRGRLHSRPRLDPTL